jgi:hypothetical protein
MQLTVVNIGLSVRDETSEGLCRAMDCSQYVLQAATKQHDPDGMRSLQRC